VAKIIFMIKYHTISGWNIKTLQITNLIFQRECFLRLAQLFSDPGILVGVIYRRGWGVEKGGLDLKTLVVCVGGGSVGRLF
jgi:hypothetical protein